MTSRPTLIQLTNFRHVLRWKLDALVRQETLPRISSGAVEELAQLLLDRLDGGKALERRRLLTLPRGIGDACWWSLVARSARATLGPELTKEQLRGIHVAVGSALRLALLEGSSYRGRLVAPCSAAVGWSEREAIAYARRFCPSRAWHEHLGPASVTLDAEPGPVWTQIIREVVARKLTARDIQRWRQLRVSYDSYVSLRGPLLLPGLPGGDRLSQFCDSSRSLATEARRAV